MDTSKSQSEKKWGLKGPVYKLKPYLFHLLFFKVAIAWTSSSGNGPKKFIVQN
jgi:hypothetical protein